MGSTSTMSSTSMMSSSSAMGSTTSSSSTSASVPTTTALCPAYSFETIVIQGSTYEIECNYQIEGSDIFVRESYDGDAGSDLYQCILACNDWNNNVPDGNDSPYCVGVTWAPGLGCYPKGNPDNVNEIGGGGSNNSPISNSYTSGDQGARLIYWDYPAITDAPSSTSSTISSTSTATSSTATGT